MDLMASIYDLVAATLTEMGRSTPSSIILTVLIRDGHFVGHKLRYEDGHATCLAGGRTIEFYDEKGNLLTTVTYDNGRGVAA